MDYFGILERSFAITRRHRVLWVFGFLLALFSFGGGGSNSMQYAFQGDEFPVGGGTALGIGIFVILMLVLIVIVLIIVAAVVSYVCQTALIGLVGEIEDGQSPTVRHGFDLGWSRRALRLFGVDLAVGIPVFLIIVFFAALFIVPIVMMSATRQGDLGPLIFVIVCCAALVVPLLILLLIGIGILQNFFHRQVVLAGDGVFDAIRHGYRLVRANLGPVIIMWLIMAVIGLLWAAVNVVLGLVALAVVGGPAALMYGVFQSGLAAVIGALPFLFVVILIFAVINALYTVFVSTVWTLTYRELPNRPIVTQAL